MTAIEARSEVGRERNLSERYSERHLHVVVVGAGFSGLSVASRLRERGEENFVVLERGESVGGVWRDNTYPGVVCDVPSHLYSLSFAPNTEWDWAFSPGAPIKDYLESVVSDWGLRPWISLREELLDAAWDDEAEAWRIVTSERRFSADVLVSCAGPLTEPAFPDMPGLDRFRGKTFHTSRWDHEHDLAGERVAGVGTGPRRFRSSRQYSHRSGVSSSSIGPPGGSCPVRTERFRRRRSGCCACSRSSSGSTGSARSRTATW